jgi:cellulose biosynthesis protein BcsQ
MNTTPSKPSAVHYESKVTKLSDIELVKTEADIEIKKLETNSSAKDVASKAVGKWGLLYITLIILIGVGSSYFLTESAITAVMTMIGGALVALISMIQGITGTREKEEKPEFKVMSQLITQLQEEKTQKNQIINGLIQQINEEKGQQMSLNVEKDRVTVSKGRHKVTTRK